MRSSTRDDMLAKTTLSIVVGLTLALGGAAEAADLALTATVWELYTATTAETRQAEGDGSTDRFDLRPFRGHIELPRPLSGALEQVTAVQLQVATGLAELGERIVGPMLGGPRTILRVTHKSAEPGVRLFAVGEAGAVPSPPGEGAQRVQLVGRGAIRLHDTSGSWEALASDAEGQGYLEGKWIGQPNAILVRLLEGSLRAEALRLERAEMAVCHGDGDVAKIAEKAGFEAPQRGAAWLRAGPGNPSQHRANRLAVARRQVSDPACALRAPGDDAL